MFGRSSVVKQPKISAKRRALTDSNYAEFFLNYVNMVMAFIQLQGLASWNPWTSCVFLEFRRHVYFQCALTDLFEGIYLWNRQLYRSNQVEHFAFRVSPSALVFCRGIFIVYWLCCRGFCSSYTHKPQLQWQIYRKLPHEQDPQQLLVPYNQKCHSSCPFCMTLKARQAQNRQVSGSPWRQIRGSRAWHPCGQFFWNGQQPGLKWDKL